MALPKVYQPEQHESTMYQQWENSGAFTPQGDATQPPFVIMLPPPNITGSLHMGHALQDTIMDALVRFQRMQGRPTLWVPGTDHAAIATNRVLEKQLAAEGISRAELGREAFLQRAEQWYEKTGAVILEQMKRLGCSCDWSRTRFTMDPQYVRAVHESFVRYFERGFIYRGNRIVNWCPRCQSVVSDLEVQHQEQETQLITLRYPLAEGGGHIDVATTRPETMLGDTAVAVHPADTRYQALVGKEVRLPITDRLIPIIADERIEQDFGTGAVKVTPAHDPFDAELALTHQLPSLNIIAEDGHLTEQAGDFAGMSTVAARAAVLERLNALGLVVESTAYRHQVALCDRCGTVIEPLISRQWFVDMQKLKGETIEVAEKGLVSFFPPRWQEHFLTWMRNVHDWTISRQIWLGQQIPVWWKPGVRGTEKEQAEGSFIVSVEKPAGEWEQDPDVLDTWFSSALWPLATLGWPEATSDLARFYPTSVLVTARDILYLWVARMIFSGLEHLKGEEYGNRSQAERIPFQDVFIYPTVLTKQGQRMSKSLGTGIDPLELIKEYGADATRFGLLYQMTYDSQAIKFDEASIKTARNFANKLWNIARFLEGLPAQEKVTVVDTWIQERAQHVAQEVSQLLESYQLGEAARRLYEFVWDDFADWYIEILKVSGGSTAVVQEVWETILKLLHPFMPHITEVLWSQANGSSQLITAAWPSAEAGAVDASAASTVDRLIDIVRTIRSARVLLGISPRTKIQVYVEEVPLSAVLAALGWVEVVEIPGEGMKAFPLPSGGRVMLGGAALTATAVQQALARLTKERGETQAVLQKLEQILAQMQDRAPAERIAAKEREIEATRQRLAEIERSQALLQ